MSPLKISVEAKSRLGKLINVSGRVELKLLPGSVTVAHQNF